MMNIRQKLVFITSGAAVFLSVGLLDTKAVIAASLNNSFGLTNPSTVITFDEIRLQEPTPAMVYLSDFPGVSVTTEYSGLGVIFSNLFYDVNRPSICRIPGGCLPNFEGPVLNNVNGSFRFPFRTISSTFSIRFLQNQTEAAFTLGTNTENTTLTALLDGVPLESFAATRNIHGFPENLTDYANINNFYGFTNITFNEIRVDTGSSNSFIAIDNLQLSSAQSKSVPEPSSLLGTLALGIIGVNSLRKRKYSN